MFQTSQGIGWGIEESNPRYYQITGRCSPTGGGRSPCSGRVVVLLVRADDIHQVWDKVRDKKLNLTVEKVIMFLDDTGINYRNVTAEVPADLAGGNAGSPPGGGRA